MTNIIHSHISNVDVNLIDTLLPFENMEVKLWHIDNVQTGYGHWALLLDIDVNGNREILRAVTTDSKMIDYWNGDEDNKLPDHYAPDYEGRLQAIEVVLTANEGQLMELAETAQDETN
jgi:hypothetical protein